MHTERGMRALAVWLGLMTLATLAACGKEPLQPPADGAAGSGSAGSGSAGVGGGSGGAAGGQAMLCPTQPPADGSPCPRVGLACGWGDDVRGDMCRTQGDCEGGSWRITPPSAPSCPPLKPIGACPADLAAACAMDTTCGNADGTTCRCTNCRPTAPLCNVASPPAWYCPKPPPTTGCPVSQPNFGQACTVQGVECNYFAFECGVPNRVCDGGIWTKGQTTGCPLSSRRAKQDIRYLSTPEVAAMAAQTLKLRLATYEYRAAPLAGRRHLGFIIEDSPGVPAVDRDGDMVDLYGYTSMLLATTQAQQREIEALRRQVERLARAVERRAR
jgi:hypothetical protein